MIPTRRLAGLVMAMIVIAACNDPRAGSARAQYNDALAALKSGDLDAAADGFLDARGDAGGDETLRFQAAFNLAVTLAKQAEAARADAPEKALDLYRQSASWFRDAVRTRPDDDAARKSLAGVVTRIQVLADELSSASRTLAGRLDGLIADQRGIRDRIRGLDEDGAQAGAIAASERALVAEAGAIADLAGDEIAGIKRRAGDKPAARDAGRIAQLGALSQALSPVRTAMADTRRALRDGDPTRGGRRAQDAIAALVLARELLMAPATVLARIAGDEARLAAQTEVLSRPEPGPKWLSNEFLASAQRAIHTRLSILRQRINAIATAPAPAAGNAANSPTAAPGPDTAAAEEQKRAASASLPHVDTALAAMDEAATHLDDAKLDPAQVSEHAAIDALALALEEHANIRQLIELSIRDHARASALLAPPADGAEVPSPEDAEKTLTTLTTRNAHRLERLATLLSDAGAKAKKPEAKKLYEIAESERAAAATALADLLKAIPARSHGDAATAAATAATEHLEALRALFLSIVERLQKLASDEAQNRDITAGADLPDASDPAGDIARAAAAENEHQQRGDALAQALAKQADALAAKAQSAQPGPKTGPGADAFATAAEETRAAATAMASAHTSLATAKEQALTASVDLSPALDDQQSAIDHLHAAIDALTPKQKKQNKQKQSQNKQGQDNNQGNQNQNKQKSQSQDQSAKAGKKADKQPTGAANKNALRQLQAIRDREAQRARDHHQADPAPSDPVEKDW